MHDLFLERERGAALVRERRVGDRPAVVQLADELVVGHEHLVEEHLVELGVARDLHERPHLDAGRLHVDDEVGDALVLRRVGVGAGEADPPPRRTARTTSTPSGPRAASRRRRASARVCSDARSEPASGSLNSWHQISPAVRIDGSHRCFCSSVPCASSVGPGEVDADPVDRLQRARPRVLHVEDRDLHRRRATAAVLDRPVDADPAVCGELRLPRPAALDLVGDRLEPRRHLEVVREPLADLGRERLLLGA